MKQRKKKIKAIISINIILIMIILLIYSKYYNSYAGSFPTGRPLGFGQLTNDKKGAPAGTLRAFGKRVYCLNEKRQYTNGLLYLETIDEQLSARSGTNYNSRDEAEAEAKAARDKQLAINGGYRAKLEEISRDGSKETALTAVAKEAGYSDESIQKGLWNNNSAISKAADMILDWENESNFKGLIKIESGGEISYSDGEYRVNNIKVTFPQISLNGTKFVDVDVSVSDGGSTIGWSEVSGQSFEVSVPYKPNLTKITITANITYPAGITITEAPEFYKVFTSKLTVKADSDLSISNNISYVGAQKNNKTGEITPRHWNWSVSKATKTWGPWLSDDTQEIMKPGNAVINKNTIPIETTVSLKPPTITPPTTTPPTTTPPPPEEEYGMQIAGTVWDDGATEGKDQRTNGAIDNEEQGIEGVLVSLYEADTGNLAELIDSSGKRTFTDSDNNPKGTLPSTNPTITDKNGYYIFKNVRSDKKYYIKFTYNGMDYIQTATNENTKATLSEYNTERWVRSSKGSELTKDRSKLNDTFKTIGSTPNNYIVTKAIFNDATSYLSVDNNTYYNKVFLESDLKEIKEEVYKQEIQAIRRGKSISIEKGKYIENVLNKIIERNGENKKIKQQLQYLYDCKIDSYAGYNSEEGGTSSIKSEYYPVYDNFLLSYQYLGAGGNKKNENGSYDYKLGLLWKNDVEMEYPYTDNKGYGYIYIGQYYVNQGLLKRGATSLTLSQDLYKTVVSINKKDEEYKYGTLSDKELTLNEADFISKETGVNNYTQQVSPDEYNYKVTQGFDKVATYDNLSDDDKIHIYATYKIGIKNLSNMPTSINEIVTYFDRKYLSYSDSYETTAKQQIAGLKALYSYDKTIDITDKVKVNEHSRCGTKSETLEELELSKINHDYTDLYLRIDESQNQEGILLETNAGITIYITYEVGGGTEQYPKFKCSFNNGDKSNAEQILQAMLGDKNNGGNTLELETITEINSFSTFYKRANDSSEIQSKFMSKYKYFGNAYRSAGVLDTFSIPGNLDKEQISFVKDHSGRAKEHDWDYAPTLVLSNPGGTRTIQGNVWETAEYANEYLKDANNYPTFDANKKIKDLTVELIEIKDDKQYVRAKTQTDSNGGYIIEGFMPGDYVIRFVYGDKAIYSEYKENKMNGIEYDYPYNGEFYQSAKANPNTNNEVVENEKNTRFWYAEDENNGIIRYSDAYDEANRRNEVNIVFNNDSKNGYVYADAVDTIVNPTKYMMYAYTGLMEIYPEKAKTKTEVGTNEQALKPVYDIKNIDFALTPRTETKLSIDKKVSNIKLILQNGKVQFDATPEDIRNQKVPGVVQAKERNNINISMTNELINGSTIEITYKITVTNVSDYNSVKYYYKDNNKSEIIALALYEEPLTDLLTYEKNHMKFDSSIGVATIENRELTRTYLINNNEKEIGTTKLERCITERLEETTTRPSVVADFVSSNLNFTNVDSIGRVINSDWEIYKVESGDIHEIFANQYYNTQIANDKFKNIDSTEVYNVNTIVVSNNTNPLVTTDLKGKDKNGNGSGQSSTSYITLSKVISTESDLLDPKQYKNNVRITSINNSVSRIQDLNSSEPELKLSRETETITINEPTGENRGYMLITLTIIVISIIGIGTVLIKKFVLK